MNYEETVDYLCNQLPFFQKSGKKAYKANLDNTNALAKFWDHPENKFKSIHIAGTNGKGSTAHMLASIFQEKRHKTGLYTSPHIKDFRERIKINGELCDKEFVVNFIDKSKSFIDEIQPTFFELTTIMAFEYFAQNNLDIAIIETGLGGRLDCTNIVTPEASVLTSISIDHVGILGNDLNQIAKEKAGIIKTNKPVIVHSNPESVILEIESIAREKNAKVILSEKTDISPFANSCPLIGDHQLKNLKSVVSVCKELESFDLCDQDIVNGLLNMNKNTPIMGRWQTIQEQPKVIVDTGHNEEAFEVILKQLEKEKFKTLRMVIGFMQDKEVDKVVAMLPKDAVYYFTAPKMPRALYPTHLKEKGKSKLLKGEEFGKIKLAYNTALQEAHPDDLIFVGGSTFMAEAIL